MKPKRYVFSADEIINILIEHIRNSYGLPGIDLDVNADWNIRKEAEDNNIVLVIEEHKKEKTNE